MAKSFITIFIVFCYITASSTARKPGHNREKLTHFSFYLHDIVTGKNPSAIRVAEAPITNSSSTFFGLLVVIDDPLTTTPDINSKLVGRAQGIYASSSQSEVSLFIEFNLVFIRGKYKGSTISVQGRNPVLEAVREFPIIGGTGNFRFARGYVEARTHEFDQVSGDAVDKIDVYVTK